MRRAERKLQLCHNVVGDDITKQEGIEAAGVEASDMQSVIIGLQLFDVNSEKLGKLEGSQLNAMADKVIAMRRKQIAGNDDRKFEVNPCSLLKGGDLVLGGSPVSLSFNSDLDEASYQSWVEKFAETDHASSDLMDLKSGSNLSEKRCTKLEAAKKKAEDKKLSEWEALGYHSLSVKDPISPADGNILSDSGSVQFVYGDCTNPSKICPSEPTIIFRLACLY